ncbi:hypothetical protein KP509_20G081200 [Ceratopteris richardii]|uniref:Uncharacterized protein n=1 Tax=Ceratopteris richardii TaxID=49495 RepID=A0A8T2SIV4_CERRI|nr:hypothetical protein KP509_20G081200 [Ceratopteris richardii]
MAGVVFETTEETSQSYILRFTISGLQIDSIDLLGDPDRRCVLLCCGRKLLYRVPLPSNADFDGATAVWDGESVSLVVNVPKTVMTYYSYVLPRGRGLSKPSIISSTRAS